MSEMTRKQFLGTIVKGAAGIVGVAAVTSAAACGSGGGGTDAAPLGNCVQNGTSVSIAANHGHVLMVDKADVVAGVAKTYDIMGTADHTHSVTISAGNMTSLKANTSITVQSTTSGSHMHSITVICA